MYLFYLESGSKNKAMMMVAKTMHVRYMVLISNISESGGLSKLSIAWFPITQKFDPHKRNSSSDSIVLLSPIPPPWPPLDNTWRAQKKKVSWVYHAKYNIITIRSNNNYVINELKRSRWLMLSCEIQEISVVGLKISTRCFYSALSDVNKTDTRKW